MDGYRCESGCLNCGHFWVTRKRNTTKPPARCTKCNSSKTYVIRSYTTDEKPMFVNEDYEKLMENLFRDYMEKLKKGGTV